MAEEIFAMHIKLFIFLVLTVSFLAACGVSDSPTPAPAASEPTSAVQVTRSTTPTINRPTRIPTQTSELRIRDWALQAYTDSCDRNYREDVTEFNILNIGQGNITERMKTDQGIEEVWCVTIAGKCGNVDFTRNLSYMKASGKWRADFQDPDWWGPWEKLGCPFQMIR